MKKLLKKAFFTSVVAIFGIISFAGTTQATNFTSNANGTAGVNVAGSTNIGSDGTGEATLIGTIRSGINIVLGFLGLIALCILLWGGFQMVTAAGDDTKYKKWFTILRQAGIGLIFIGVAALIVNLIMWFIGSIAGA